MIKQQQFLALTILCLAAIVTAAAGSIQGRDFWSNKVVEDGEEKDLVPGTRIKIKFHDEGRFSAGGGCNSIGGQYALNEDVLIVTDIGIGMRGCENTALHDQDEFVLEFFSAQPKVEQLETGLILRTDSTTIAFEDRAIADLDRPLVGTKWDATGFFDPMVASSMAVAKAGWIQLLSSGSLSFFNGCTEHHNEGTYTVSDTTITFNNVEVSACESDDMLVKEYATNFQKLFETETVAYDIVGPKLDIQNENGVGVSFRASNEGTASSYATDPSTTSDALPLEEDPSDLASSSASSSMNGMYFLVPLWSLLYFGSAQ